MRFKRALIVVLALFATSAMTTAQGNAKTGSIKGKVRVESGSASGVTVTLNRAGRDIGEVSTNRKGEFSFSSLQPGSYGLTFRKPGLSVGTLEDVEVKAGKVNELNDRLIMAVDEGAVAFVRGSVFSPEGRSVPGARVEVARINNDGSTKKIDTRVTGETGQFVFRLPPSIAKYRFTAKVEGSEPVSQEVQVDGAAVYRIALNLKISSK